MTSGCYAVVVMCCESGFMSRAIRGKEMAIVKIGLRRGRRGGEILVSSVSPPLYKTVIVHKKNKKQKYIYIHSLSGKRNRLHCLSLVV